MKFFIWTISVQIKALFQNALVFPVWFSLAVSIIYIIIVKWKYKQNINTRTIKDRILPLTVMTFIYAMIAQLTIIRRFGTKVDSFSQVWEGWLPFRQEFSFDLTAIENIIMFIPLTLAVNWFILTFRKKSFPPKRIILISTTISFGMSLFIEVSQAIFSIGMFQISDLTYNTLGGIIGAVIFNRIIKKTRKDIS